MRNDHQKFEEGIPVAARPKEVRAAHELDGVDRRMVELLAANARMSNAELAGALGVAPSTAHVRLRSLMDRGVITEFVTSLDQASLGLPIQALIGVTLRPGARQASLVDFSEEVRNLHEVLQLFFLGGQDDFVVHVAVADTSALRTFVVDHLSGQPSVASTRTSIVFEYHRSGAAASFR